MNYCYCYCCYMMLVYAAVCGNLSYPDLGVGVGYGNNHGYDADYRLLCAGAVILVLAVIERRVLTVRSACILAFLFLSNLISCLISLCLSYVRDVHHSAK